MSTYTDMNNDYILKKRSLLGDLTINSQLVEADCLEEELKTLHNKINDSVESNNAFKGLVLNANTKDINQLVEIIGQMLVRLGGTYSDLPNHLSETGYVEMINDMFDKLSVEYRKETEQQIDLLKHDNPNLTDSCEKIYVLKLMAVANSLDIDVSQLLKNGKNSPTTENEYFIILQVIDNKLNK